MIALFLFIFAFLVFTMHKMRIMEDKGTFCEPVKRGYVDRELLMAEGSLLTPKLTKEQMDSLVPVDGMIGHDVNGDWFVLKDGFWVHLGGK